MTEVERLDREYAERLHILHEEITENEDFHREAEKLILCLLSELSATRTVRAYIERKEGFHYA